MSRVIVYASHGFAPMEALMRGIETVSPHHITRRALLYGSNDYERCFACAVFGAKDPADRIIADQIAHETPVLVVDLGYIKRGNLPAARADPTAVYWSVNLNGLNGWGDPPRSPMPADRWEQLNVSLAPWQEDGEYILVCSQKPHDAALGDVSPHRWAEETVAAIRMCTSRPILWRPHPEDMTSRRLSIPGTTKSHAATLQEDLQVAYATIAYNSNALVESLLAGIPIFIVGEGSVCEGMGYDHIGEEELNNPLRPDREQFFADLAYRQWTMPEMEQGLPWRHFFEGKPATLATSDQPPVASLRKRGRPRKQKPTDHNALTSLIDSASVTS